jgi:hypothetical protein
MNVPASRTAALTTSPSTPVSDTVPLSPNASRAAIPASVQEHSAAAANPPTADASPTLWQRFVLFLRGLFGDAPSTPVRNAATPPPAPPPPNDPVVAESAAPITPEVKSLIADEIGRQIEQEAHEARVNAQNQQPKPGAGGIVEALRRPTQHVFVVASDLDLVDDNGRRCMISEGDVVQIVSAVNVSTQTAQAIVLSSKGGVECAHSATVDIGVTDLQEMQNHMRATIDQGLANTPRGAAEPTVTPAFVAAAPPPDADARSAIEQQKAIAANIDRS